MKVSIIIPVYNAEKYLKRCIDSCLNQTLEDIEIVLVDDCSQDGSKDIILDYERKYPDTIKHIFQKENHRQGAARNRGMEIATGEYLAFVDSDDWIEPDMCELLYEKAKEIDADMVGADYFFSWDDREKEILLDWHNDDVGNMTKEKKKTLISMCGMFWARIYRRKFIESKKIKFPEDVFYEDAFFNFYSILLCDSVLKVDKAFYHYYQVNESTIRNRNQKKQYERIDAAEILYNFVNQNNELGRYRDIVFDRYIDMSCSTILYVCLDSFDKPSTYQLRRIHKLMSEKKRDYMKSEAFLKLNDKIRFFVKINAISPRLCVLSYKLRIYDILKKAETLLK